MFDLDGIYCDCKKCGGLAVVNDSLVYTSIPPKYSYRCPSCDYRGYVDCDKAYRIDDRRDNSEFYKELQAEQQEQM